MERDVLRLLQGQVEAFVADLPFFETWQPGLVSRKRCDGFLLEFDHLVASFPTLIAYAISRLGEAGRVVLAKNLFEECGEGNATRTHHAIYRRFLRSAGLEQHVRTIDSHTRAWRDELARAITELETPGVVGVVAAGEVLAQPALSRIYDVLRPLYANADVEYFTTHLELEANHVAEIAQLLANEGATEDFASVQEGFDRGLTVWRQWFGAMTSDAHAI